MHDAAAEQRAQRIGVDGEGELGELARGIADRPAFHERKGSMGDMSRLEAVRSLVEQDPGNSRIRFMLAMEYLGASAWPQALRELAELISRDPGYLAAYYQAGQASERAGEEDQARDYYRRGITVAREAGDTHTLSELQAALDILG